jgi:hypothetical protein
MARGDSAGANLRVDFIRGFLAQIVAHITDNDFRALGREKPGLGGSLSARTARYESNFPFKPIHCGFSSVNCL